MLFIKRLLKYDEKHLSKSTINSDEIGSFSYIIVALLLERIQLYGWKMFDSKIKKHIIIKFFVKLTIITAKSFRMLSEVYDKECLSRDPGNPCIGRHQLPQEWKKQKLARRNSKQYSLFSLILKSTNTIIKRY